MAKVKIQGHASGTGVLTVTAPNTSTDRTITLPDATGTLLNSDGSGANLTSLPNGSQLDHSGSKKIEATSTGVDVTGIAVTDGITSSGNITFDNGNSSVSIKSDGADGSYIQFGSNEYLRFLYDNGASESIRLIDGGGLTFNGDTASANALDDYEVGTWTPQQSNGTAFTQNGVSRYIKIGRLVHIQADINQIPSGSQIFGLPYTLNSNYHSAITIGYSSYGSGVMGYMPGGYAQIHLHILNGSAIVANNHRFIISGSYYANT